MQAVEWVISLTADDVVAFRERVMTQLEEAGARMKACGASEAWFGTADSSTRNVVGDSNGMLLEQLIKLSEHTDTKCADLLRLGAQIIGELVRSGIGTPCEVSDQRLPNELWGKRVSNNEVLCKQLMTERGADCERLSSLVHQATIDDANRGRQTSPVPVESSNVEGVLLQPRFAVEQVNFFSRRSLNIVCLILQEREDGSMKVRAVDHFSWAPRGKGYRRKAQSVNGYTHVVESMKHDTLDGFAKLMRELHKRGEFVPAFFKVDVDSAFRRIPIDPKHRWACGVAYKCKNKVRATSLKLCVYNFVIFRFGGPCTTLAHLERRRPFTLGSVWARRFVT